MTYVFQPFTDPATKKNTTVYTYKQLAHQLFTAWKNSPPHYANMIDPLYKNAGLAIKLSANQRVLYAAQVFGSTRYVPPHNGLVYRDSTYGVKEMNAGGCRGFGDNDFLTRILSSYLLRQGDTVYQYYQKENILREIITGPKDGIALDLVYKSQFKCMEEDMLHPSSVFDGYMMKPVYRDQLFKGDLYKGADFLSYLGTLPRNADKGDMQINTILIQNGQACRYSYPVAVEAAILDEIPITPQWCKMVGKLNSADAVVEKDYEIPFEKSEKVSNDKYFDKLKQLLKVYDGAITDIEITAYSSVEGNEANNLMLQNSRSLFLENLIRAGLKQNVTVNRVAKENWALMYRQLRESGLTTLFSDTTKEGIRIGINERMYEPTVENWLNQQRVANVRIRIKKKVTDDMEVKYMPIAIEDALLREDTIQAHIAYSRMISAFQEGKLNSWYLTAVEIPLQEKNLPLISNYLAALLLEEDVFSLGNFSLRYYNYIEAARKKFSSFKPLAFNLCIYKTSNYFRGLVTDIPGFQRAELEILSFKNDPQIDTAIRNHLMYNYYLTASLVYEQQRMYKEMYTAFEKVKPFLLNASLTATEVKDIVLYFNYFFKLNESIELLEKYQGKYPEDEDLIYLYVTTGALYNTGLNYHMDNFYKQLDILAAKNKPRLCKYLNENYQLIREEELEKKICKYCKLN
jgi:hypothetical protein